MAKSWLATPREKTIIDNTMDYDNKNRGVLFRHDKKGNEKAPDYKGKLNASGTEYYLSAWLREKKDGSGKYMSISVEPKDQQPQTITEHHRAKANAYVRPQDDPKTPADEQIPF